MPHHSPLRLCSLTAALGLSLLTTPARAGAPVLTAAAPQPDGDDQFIVGFREGTAERRDPAVVATGLRALASRAASRLGANGRGLELKHLRRLAVGADVIQVDRKLGRSESEALMRELAAHPSVDYIEPDRVVEPLFVPNEPLYGVLWQYADFTNGIRPEAAWDRASGAGVVVAVLDTGILNHSDLSANQLPGYDFISESTRARDGNGRDSNPADEGDWRADGECGSGTFARNSTWHGTHVSGSIAALTHNAKGVAGVAFNSRFVPVRVLGRCGGRSSDIVDGIVWAAGGWVLGAPANANPASVINMSLGGEGACGSSYQSAINFAVERGVTVVVSAGNESADASTKSPANCANVITVAASTSSGRLAGYSNFGTTIDVTAPGSDILSTGNTGTTTPSGENYIYMNGTSMAAPHVAGIVALVKSANPPSCPGKTPAQLEALLRSTARPLPGGCPNGCGAGLVDASAAVLVAQSNQPPSSSFSYSVSNFTVDVVGYPWDCDGTVTSYVIDFGDGATSNAINASHTYSAPGSYTLTLTTVDDDGAVGVYSQSVWISGSDST